jgi:Tol biopolymer transport system component
MLDAVPRFAAPAALTALVLLVLVVMAASASLVHAAARPMEPGFDTAPQVSPNGRWLLFERLYGGSRYSSPDTSLRIALRDGSAERELVGRTRALSALWTPDSLVQVSFPHGETALRRPEDGSVVRRMPVAASAWSADGKWIAYVENVRELYVAEPDGSRPRLLATAPELGTIGVGAFSPDSTRLTFVVSPARGPSRSEVVQVDGSARRLLKEAPVISPGSWSPNGRAVVLMAQGDPARPNRYEPPRAYVIGADGSNPHRIAPGFATSPDWSPLGRWIAYLRQTPTRTKDLYDIMIVRPSGSDRRRVVRTDGAGGTWLADGRHVLSIGSGACRRWGILEIDVFKRTVKRLTNRCRIVGTPRADSLRGTALRDLIDGRGGADRVVGRGGNDRLSGGAGDDTIVSRDRYRDGVDCGSGADRVIADYRDRVAQDCEHVTRR